MELTLPQIRELKLFIRGDIICPYWLYVWANDHWLGEIPYGVQTGDDGTMDEWLFDHLDELQRVFEKYL